MWRSSGWLSSSSPGVQLRMAQNGQKTWVTSVSRKGSNCQDPTELAQTRAGRLPGAGRGELRADL